jgi:hypothetical protein
MARYVDLSVAAGAVALIGIGTAIKDVAAAMIVVGSLALVLVVVANLAKGKK